MGHRGRPSNGKTTVSLIDDVRTTEPNSRATTRCRQCDSVITEQNTVKQHTKQEVTYVQNEQKQDFDKPKSEVVDNDAPRD
jgi:hypothetical protein